MSCLPVYTQYARGGGVFYMGVGGGILCISLILKTRTPGWGV